MGVGADKILVNKTITRAVQTKNKADDFISYGREFHWAIVQGKKEYFRWMLGVVLTRDLIKDCIENEFNTLV